MAKPASFLIPVVLVCVSLIAVFGILEVVFRIRNPVQEGPALNLIEKHEPYVYRLNPEHPEINSFSARGPEVAVPKPEGKFRVLALGDSVTFGLFVNSEEAWPHQLESELQQEIPGTEVINAGTSGYTPFLERQYYREIGRYLGAKRVVIGFCFNDAVNPLRHWQAGMTGVRLTHVPDEAYPSGKADIVEDKMMEVMRLSRLLDSLYRRTFNLRMIFWRYEKFQGKRWPVYVSDESRQSLNVFNETESPEFLWLFEQYEKLRRDVEADGARLKILLFPLAYQFEDGYPFFPQRTLMKECRRRGLDCVDLYPVFREAGGKSLFMGKHRHHPRDVWHLNAEGHRVAARAAAVSLTEDMKVSGSF